MSNAITDQDQDKIKLLLETKLYTLQDLVIYFENKYTENQIRYFIKVKLPDLFSYLKRDSSKGNVKLKNILQQIFKNVTIESEYHIGNKLKLDFYIPEPYNLGFEFDGIQHFQYTPGLHASLEDFAQSKLRDKEKNKICVGRGIKLIRISFKDILTRDSVNQMIETSGYGSGNIQDGYYTGHEKRKKKQKETSKAVSAQRRLSYQKYKKSKAYADQKERQKLYRKQQYERHKQFVASKNSNKQ